MNQYAKTKYKLFLDLDGVLADFDGGVQELLGIRPDRNSPSAPPGLWKAVDEHPNFFGSLDVLADAHQLVDFCRPYEFIVLTGLPDSNGAFVAAEKRKWVSRNISPEIPVLTCSSKDKINVARMVTDEGGIPVIVDDWKKYRHLWEQGGGIFILHTSARESITKLKILGF